VVTEGIRNATDEPVYQTQDSSQQDALGRVVPGGVAAHLAGEVARRLKLRCRWEQPGLCGRASMLHASRQDLIDAEEVGRAGVRAAAAGKPNHLHMVSLHPLERTGEAKTGLVPLSRAAGQFRHVPDEWLGPTAASPVTDAFVRYVEPLVGELVEYAVPLHDRERP
jgi:6-phosphofructokinase 1